MDVFKKDCKKHVGIGGWHCHCCRPHKKEAARRHVRRKMKADTLNIIKEHIE